ncbi:MULTISPECIES: branched-chain amino acid ABC transporter substrate-binding protein [Alphaproteobacteria]|uniref:ABC transporter substrate-binding protein n=2 Tax=Alphaproteobacteria TaxID=28211 RepID=A0A512HCM6_9HYPH|nr:MULTISPECIES: branched-chain amino acid ABC transporter substrate-binding protein [Alphaproteobacteria]GEO83207.1 ABC transporter substrate-binding protein [Ciceribacter naphthalenivorans]GLR20398.1 ABC transporter substrate-binding protein [Ciceribacter naphthalenivorans]GLT03254.1 ABC transporter substrate-binding protein [Sphingomonas psychrolutea]
MLRRMLLPVLLALTPAFPALAERPKIALVAPQSGPFAILGTQIRDGAAFAAREQGLELAVIDESCEAGSGSGIARQIRESGAKAAIGFLCSESLDGALPLLKEADIPALSLSVRWKRVMEDALKNGWAFYRMAPSSDDEATRLTEVILRDWSSAAFALVDDGTIHGRELAEAIRDRLDERGLKPVFTDTFRPGQEQQVALVRRLKKAGATHVFVGGDRNDVAIIARDAHSESIALTLLGGEALNAADQSVALADGVQAIMLPDYAALPAAQAVVAQLRASGIEPEGYVLPAHAAVTVVAQAAGAALALDMPLAQAIGETHIDTVIGPISFDPQHELTDNPYRLMEWRDGRFAEPSVPAQ